MSCMFTPQLLHTSTFDIILVTVCRHSECALVDSRRRMSTIAPSMQAWKFYNVDSSAGVGPGMISDPVAAAIEGSSVSARSRE